MNLLNGTTDKLKKLKNKNLSLFFTAGISMDTWYKKGMINREISLYNELSQYFNKIYFFTYGNNIDLEFSDLLNENIEIVPKKVNNDIIYSFLLPLLNKKQLNRSDFLKTNQMMGSWAAVFSKIIYRKKLIVRTGFVASLFEKEGTLMKKLISLSEFIAYKMADGVITSSKTGFDYINLNYKPSGLHYLLPNFVDTSLFRPIDLDKDKGSICYIGRLDDQKNLFELLKAMDGLDYYLTIVGSGQHENELKSIVNERKLKVRFISNILNKDLPELLNSHEIFILPSLWEGMPKTLLEAMSCGLPVIGTDVDGINEVITDKFNGLLCKTDHNSLKLAIINLMEDDALKKKLGKNARETIIQKYSLNYLLKQELELYCQLID